MMCVESSTHRLVFLQLLPEPAHSQLHSVIPLRSRLRIARLRSGEPGFTHHALSHGPQGQCSSSVPMPTEHSAVCTIRGAARSVWS